MMACSHSFLCCISVWGDTRVNPTLSDSTLLSLGLSEESILWLSSSIWTGVFPSGAASFEFCCDTLGWVPTAPLLSDVSLQGWQGNTFRGLGETPQSTVVFEPAYRLLRETRQFPKTFYTSCLEHPFSVSLYFSQAPLSCLSVKGVQK